MTQHVYAAASPCDAANEPERFDAFLGSLSRRVVARATGTSLPAGIRLTDESKQRLWLGMLVSEPELIAEAQVGRVYKARITPPAQGFSFRVTDLPAEFEAEVSCAIYLPLHPTREEQLAVARAEQNDPAAAPPRRMAQAGATGLKLAPVWTKVRVPPVRVRVPLPADAGPAVRVGEDELAAAIRAAAQAPPGASLFRPRRAGAPAGSLPREADLHDEATWSSYCRANLMDAADVHPPEHRAAIQVEVTRQQDFYEILMVIVNTSPAPDDQLFDGVHKYESGVAETRLYEVELSVTCPRASGPLRPRTGGAFLPGTAVTFRLSATPGPVNTETGEDGSTILRTQFAAEEPTWRIYPRDSVTDGGGDSEPIDTSFDSLINDPLGTLTQLADKLDGWVARNWSAAALEDLRRERGWDANACREAEEAAGEARDEAAWVQGRPARARGGPGRAGRVRRREPRDEGGRGLRFLVPLPGRVDHRLHPRDDRSGRAPRGQHRLVRHGGRQDGGLSRPDADHPVLRPLHRSHRRRPGVGAFPAAAPGPAAERAVRRRGAPC